MKHTMSFSFNKACETSLAYDLRIWFKALALPFLFMPKHLAGHIHTGQYDVHLPGLPALSVTAWAGSLQTEESMYSKRDVLQWTDDRGNRAIGIAVGFVSTNLSDMPFAAFVHACHPDAAHCMWLPQTNAVSVLNADCIVGSVPYLMQDLYIVPLLHTTMR